MHLLQEAEGHTNTESYFIMHPVYFDSRGKSDLIKSTKQLQYYPQICFL